MHMKRHTDISYDNLMKQLPKSQQVKAYEK
jgi:hypothetical protein